MANLPPLPKIEGDVELLLDVFTHNSLRMSSAPMKEDYGDTDRLAELGAHVLRVVVATHYFRQKDPDFLPTEKMTEKIKETLSDETIDAWMNSYGLKTKLRIAPSEMQAINDTKEMRKVFETYVGALYIRNGLQSIQSWISQLIDPASSADGMDTSHTSDTYSSSSRFSTFSPPPPSKYTFSPPPPTSPPPPMPQYPPTAHGYGTQALAMVSVALLNQKASQSGLQVTYPAEYSGPPHQPLWNVRCCLNGREYGRGTGKSQKIAKEDAARKAWAAMGW